MAYPIRTNIKEGLKGRVSEVLFVPKSVNQKKNHISVCVCMGCHTFYSFDQNLTDAEAVTSNRILFNVRGWPMKKTVKYSELSSAYPNRHPYCRNDLGHCHK